MPVPDGILFRRAFAGMFDGLADAETFFNNFLARSSGVSVTDGGTAATAVTGTPIFKVQGPQKVREVTLTLPVAVTADATNRLTITVSKSLNGGALTTIATGTTTAGDLGSFVALSPKVIPLSTVAGATSLADGEEVTVAITKQGTGQAIAAATSSARVEVEYEPL